MNTAAVAAQTPFYLDWKFWSVVVSCLALVLSQLPPVHILLRRARLELEVYSQLYLLHKLGNPNAQLHLIVNNVGGRKLRITRISMHFRHDTGVEFHLPAFDYFQAPSDKDALLMTSFRLKPQEDWAHIIRAFNPFSRQEQKRVKELEANLRQNILAKREELPDKSVTVPADEGAVKPLMTFFDEKFKWQPGEYEMTLTVEALPKRATRQAKFRFTIFESDAKELMDLRDEYKYGFGVILDSAQTQGILVPLSPAL